MQSDFGIGFIPEDDQQRLAALKRYRILGTEDEHSFTTIAQTAAEMFGVPMVMISLVDEDKVYFKSSVGMASSVLPRSESICALTILQPEVNVIENALKNPAVASSPLVCGELGLRFYAGAPLITHDGFRIGTVCVADTQPRQFSGQNKRVLQGMARIVMEQLELRLTNLLDAEKQAQANTQLKAANQELEVSERRFQKILNTMAEGVGIIDATGQLIYANIMAQRILGLTQSEIKGRNYDDPEWQNLRVDGTPLPGNEHPMAIMMATGMAVYDHEIGVQPTEGEPFYISINAAPILDDEGKLTGGIGTFMDVTQRRREMQQKDEFISVASHELKTPVTSLKASMQLMERMKDNPKPEVLAKMIAQSNRSLNKLTALITDLLDTNRISQGQLHLRKTTFTIGDMISDCCNHIRTAGSHEITLQGELDLQLCADEQQIDQVIVNFVNNAVKYAPTSKQIHITIERADKMAKVSVKDNGPGVPPEKLPHLFDRYYRADYSGIQVSGLGLGLYISAEIIKKHGGQIGVNSQPGQGSTFWFTVPLA